MGTPASAHGMDVVEVDGNIVEGGGQVLRNCAACAAILGKSVHFVNIRAHRTRPGLRQQYLEGLEVVGKLSNPTLVNAFVDSKDVWFIPGPRVLVCSDRGHSMVPCTTKREPSKYEFHTKAALTGLLLQASLPVLLFSVNVMDLELTGGARIPVSPSIDYMKHVLLPTLHKHFKVQTDIDIVRRDSMPSGGAFVKVRIYPTESLLPPIRMFERGSVVRISGILYGYGKVEQHFIDAVQVALNDSLKCNGFDMNVTFSSDMQGLETEAVLVCRILLYAEMSTGCILGGSSAPEIHDCEPEQLASSAVLDLVKQLADGGCTDEYLQDQVIIFMALADGVSEIITGPLTTHTETAIHYAHHMTDAQFTVTSILGSDRNLIRCQGIGFSVKAPTDQFI